MGVVDAEVLMAGGTRGAAVAAVSRVVDGEGADMGIPPEDESSRFFGDASFLGMRFGETQFSTEIMVQEYIYVVKRDFYFLNGF